MKFKLKQSSDWHMDGWWTPIEANAKLAQVQKQLEGWTITVEGDGRHDQEGNEWYELFIEIKDLDNLTEFTNKFGSIVFDTERIEIYDDYRE